MSLTDRETEGRRKLEELAARLAASAAQAGYANGLNLAAASAGGANESNKTNGTASAPAAKPGTGAVDVSTASTVAQSAKPLTGVLGAMANLNPIVAGLMRIFGGGGGEQAAPVLTKIERPEAVRYQGGVSEQTGWGMGEIDYSANGMPRPANGAAQTPVVVQVQAIDSRSFLDHRDEIASAVRQALLESHGLGDVMREA